MEEAVLGLIFLLPPCLPRYLLPKQTQMKLRTLSMRGNPSFCFAGWQDYDYDFVDQVFVEGESSVQLSSISSKRNFAIQCRCARGYTILKY